MTELMATDFGAVNPSGLVDVATPATAGITEATQSVAPQADTLLSGQAAPSAPASPAAASLETPAGYTGTMDAAGSAGTNLPGSTVHSPGLIKQAMEWARKNEAMAAAILQAGGSMVAGIGQGAGAYLTEQQKLENQKKITEYYRKHVQSGSAGGKGVNLGMAPKPGADLRMPSGGLVRRFMS